MSEAGKRLYFRRSADGATGSCSLYSSTGDLITDYAHVRINCTEYYVPLVGTSDARATALRVSKNGNTYAVGYRNKRIYTMSVSQPANGSITVNGSVGTSFGFDEGTAVTVAAYPNSSYSLSSLIVNGSSVSSPYSFSINGNSSASASMALNTPPTGSFPLYGGSGNVFYTSNFTVPALVTRLRMTVYTALVQTGKSTANAVFIIGVTPGKNYSFTATYYPNDGYQPVKCCSQNKMWFWYDPGDAYVVSDLGGSIEYSPEINNQSPTVEDY